MSKKFLTPLVRYLLSYQNTEIILSAAQVFFTNDIFIEIYAFFHSVFSKQAVSQSA